MHDPRYDRSLHDPTIDLSHLDDEYVHAPLEENTHEPVPDGRYQVSVERVELVRAKSSRNPMLRWALRILAPRCQGRRLFRHNMLATRDNMKWLKHDLHVCGLRLDRVSDLQSRLADLLDVQLEITKRTLGDNENVYFNHGVVRGDRPAPPAARHVSDAGDDQIPF